MDPIHPAASSSTPHETGTATNTGTTGLPSNVAAALACIPLVGGIIFYVIEKRDGFVRFYAMQSIIFGAAWIMFDIISKIISAVFSAVPGVGGIFAVLWGLVWALVTIGFLVVFIITVIKAFTGVRWDIPYIGPVARKQTDGVGL